MADEDFAFDAYDRLVGRTSMASSPISLIVRNPPIDDLERIVERCLTLLSDRRFPDEILIVVGCEPKNRPPAMVASITVRTVVLPSIATKAGLEWALANAKNPIAIFVGSGVELPDATFRKMQESLEHADIVVGRRRSLRGRRNPLSWIVRRLFGVAVSDPLSPFIGFRREVVAGIPLELNEPLAPFDLLSKSTFAFAIYDEVDCDAGPASPPLHRILFERRVELIGLFRRPTFWRYSASDGRVRTPPQETAPPNPAGMGGVAEVTRSRIHPLRRQFVFRRPPVATRLRSAVHSR